MTFTNRIETAIALSGLLAIAAVAYSIFMMSSTVEQMRPLVQIANDMEVTISTAHLWFEEALEGDKSIDLKVEVYGNIDAAITAVEALRNQMQRAEPELFEQVEERFDRLEFKLKEWRKQTDVRWNQRFTSAPGTPSDQAYDALFREILGICGANKDTINSIVIRRQKMLTKVNASLIAFLILVFSILAILSVRYRKIMQAKNLTVLKLSQAIEQTDDLVTITNREGLIEYVNPAFEKHTGFTNQEVIGFKLSILKSGKHDRAFYQKLWDIIIAGKVFRSEIINRKKNGELFYEEKTISPIRNSDGDITHYVSTAKDITERKKIETELIHSREMKMIGQLASGVAHEVRNPLSAILAISEAMFHDFSGQPEYAEYLVPIRNQVNRLSALMRDLLELGKPIPESTMSGTSITMICRSSIDLWRQYNPNLSHSVRLFPPEHQEKAVVYANRGKLQQVFVNLLDNAAQHSPAGTEIRVVINEPVEKQICVCIQDQGPGISGENTDRLFEPFFTTRKSGTGLGLSIVKHIVETHGGTVSIRNNDPVPGCCVEVILPLTRILENETTDTSH